MKKTYLVGPDKLYKRSLDSAVSSLLALISGEYAQLVQRTTGLYTVGTPEHQWFSGSELMRFIHHIITYVVPATPRVINWARPLTQKNTSHVYIWRLYSVCVFSFTKCIHKRMCMYTLNQPTKGDYSYISNISSLSHKPIPMYVATKYGQSTLSGVGIVERTCYLPCSCISVDIKLE